MARREVYGAEDGGVAALREASVTTDAEGRRMGAPGSVARAMLQQTASKAAQRLNALLDDEEAWGRDGWLRPKEQVAFLREAMDRGFGRAVESVVVDQSADGQPSALQMLGAIYAKLAEQGMLPERAMAATARAVVEAEEAKVVEPAALPTTPPVRRTAEDVLKDAAKLSGAKVEARVEKVSGPDLRPEPGVTTESGGRGRARPSVSPAPARPREEPNVNGPRRGPRVRRVITKQDQ